MSTDLATFAATKQASQPQQAFMQPVRTSDLLITVAVIAAIGILIGAGYVLERVQRRSKARTQIKTRPVRKTGGNSRVAPQRRNLRLVTPKRR